MPETWEKTLIWKRCIHRPIGRVGAFPFLGFVFLGIILNPLPALAQFIDRVEVNSFEKESEIHIVFNTRVVYQSHFPETPSDFVRIKVLLPQLDADARLIREVQPSPPNGDVPGFTVTFPDELTGQKKSLAIKFEKTVTFKVKSSKDRDRIIVVIPLRAQKERMPSLSSVTQVSPPISPPNPVSVEQSLEQQARELLTKGRKSLEARNLSVAISTFLQLLKLPDNAFTQEAHELIGLAYIGIGDYEKAKNEYEQYLKLYEGKEGAIRVQEKLLELDNQFATGSPGSSDKTTSRKTEKSQTILRDIKIVSTSSAAEIRVSFHTPVRYLYRFPLKAGKFVRLHLMFPEIDSSKHLSAEQWPSPPSDLIPPFQLIFPDQETKKTRRLSLVFNEEVLTTVRNGKDKRTIVIAVPLKETAKAQKVKPNTGSSQSVPVPDMPPSPGSDSLATAEDLIAKGREALTSGENQKAIQLFNSLLQLPPNEYSQDAQELVGVARDRAGEWTHAKQEYELYLKLYPEGEGTDRVRQRLAVLKEPEMVAAKPKELRQRKSGSLAQTSYYGNFSQYYYGGHSRINSKIVDGGFQTITNDDFMDQSLLVSTLNLTGRYRLSQSDTQVVLRGSDTENFLASNSGQSSQRLRRAYLKHEDSDWAYLMQIGRQPGNKGGVLGAFDGGWLGYQGFHGLGFNLMGGMPAQVTGNSDLTFSTDRYFVGGNVDLTPDGQNWSGNLYMINQMVSGIVDRQAVGGEARFFLNGLSLFSLVDFDVSYRLLNIAMFNGSWQLDGGTTFNLLLDHRTTPTMQTTNAVLATGAGSVQESLQTINEDTLRDYAKAVTAKSDLIVIGVIHPLTSLWQLGGDVRFNRTTGTSSAGTQPALAGSGDIFTYTMQTTGNEVFFRNHTLSLTASYIDNPSYKAQSFVVNSLARFWENWQLDTFVNFYAQEDQAGTNVVRVTPSARLSYRWKENMTFEIQGGVERLTTNGTTQEEEILRDFFSFGYIWEH